MFTEFSNFIQSNYPGLFLACAGIVLTWKISAAHAKFDNKLMVMEEDIDFIKSDLGSLRKDVDTLSNRVDAIAKTLDNLLTFLKDHFEKFPVNIIKAKSPLDLTSEGEQLLQEIGGKAYLDQHMELLIDELSQWELKSALDVQHYAATIFFNKTDSDAFVPIKDFIYHHPSITIKGITIDLKLSLVVGMMGLYLRNRYLEVHPGIIREL